MSEPTQFRATPSKPMFTLADLNNPAMAQALAGKAREVGMYRGHLLGKVIKEGTDHIAKERDSNNARDDVITIFIWQAFGFPINSNEANMVRRGLPQWIIDALFRGMDEGVRIAWEEKEKQAQPPIPPRAQ
ncbi:MAG: hypothetical protein LVQ95_04170 [Candidatus Micrarchaeales archaeon]|nr:hypothetical protein [Candidatus Micrarchaeales archaeon]